MITAARTDRSTSGAADVSPAYPAVPQIDGAPPEIQAALDEVRDRPRSIEKRYALADLLRAAAYHAQAVTAYTAVIEMDPLRASAYRDLGNVLVDSGENEQGLERLRRAVAMAPDEPGALLGLIRTLQKLGRLEEAMPYVELLGGTSSRHPRDPRRKLFYGLALSQVGQLEKSIETVRASLALDDSDAEAWDFLGMLLTEGRDWENARAAYDRVLELVPGRPQTLFNRATLRLRLGDLVGGFADYEARWDSPLFTTPRRDYGLPRWRGEPLNGQIVLLSTEQGLGDTLQFVRFARFARESGAGRVILECEDSMVRLLASVEGIDEIVRRGQPLPVADLQAPLMSLPHFMGVTLDSVASKAPYLGIDRTTRMLPPRNPSVRLRVGLVWEASRSGGSFRAKSIPLEKLAPLAARSDIELISLQKGPGAQSLAASPLSSRIADIGSRLVDFRDTAEVLAQLDVVLSVDTAVCHLAGAMGVPVWTMLPATADWRWLLERDDSPWYPSMRLFRQDAAGDWTSALDAVEAGLSTLPASVVRTRPQFAPRAVIAPDAQLLAALKHQEQGEFLEAACAYNDALVIDGSSADVWNSFGVALARSNRFVEAITAFTNALSRDETHDDAHRNLATVRAALMGAGRPAPQSTPASPMFALDWQVGMTSGWGIYGLNLVSNALRIGRFTPVLFHEPQFDNRTSLSRDDRVRLAAGLAVGRQVLQRHGGCGFPTLHALGNGMLGGPLASQIRSTRRVGIVFFEDARLDASAVARGRGFDRIVAGSTWNADLLKASGLQHTALVFQGIDTGVFHPAPQSGRLRHRFVVFSGGKLEYRKGQDLVVAAFARFRQRHPDALLMVAWHNHWPQTMAEIVTAGHVHDLPALNAQGQLETTAWLSKYGIPADAVLDLGLVPNAEMPPLMREANVAVFPNRAEGGTNLVAMEALACAIPCILSANTGHLDLTSESHNIVLTRQGACRPTRSFGCTDGWGECEVDEIVEALDFAYTKREEAHRRAASAAAVMAQASWRNQIDRLFDSIGDLLV